MGHKIRGILILCILVLCASIAHAKGIKMILGATVDGTIPPAGTCPTAALQLVRDSGVEISASALLLDFDVDVTNSRAFATLILNPMSGNNFFKLSTVSPISVTNSLALKIDPSASGFCNDSIGPPFAFCVLPHAVRYDSVGSLIYPVGAQIFADNVRTIGLVTTGAVLNSINDTYSVGASGGGDSGAVVGFDSEHTLSWFGMASIDGVSNPNNLIVWRVNTNASASVLQGPISFPLATNISTLSNGNMQVDLKNSFLYIGQTDTAGNTINLRTFDFTLTQQMNHTINSDFAAPGTLNGNGMLWIDSKNELVVCTGNFLIVYSGFPFTVKRSTATGCNSPAYDPVNNKLYVFRSQLLARINYDTLAQEAIQGVTTGLTAGHRLYMDYIHQFVYGVEQAGPSSATGVAMAKFDTCSSV